MNKINYVKINTCKKNIKKCNICEKSKQKPRVPNCICPPGARGPVGPQGPAGQSETITIRNTTTTDPGTDALVVDVSGSPNHILDFYIPKGDDGEKGDVGPQGPKGDTGPAGPQGPAGNMGTTTCCLCVKQMINVLSQLITLYPTQTATVNMESGTVSGRLNMVYPSVANGGLLFLSNGTKVTEVCSICHIASVKIASASYNDNITYLPSPSPLPIGCDTDCEEAIRKILPVGTQNVNLKAGGQSIGSGNVKKNEFGIIVLTNSSNQNPTFVSACKIEIADEFVLS